MSCPTLEEILDGDLEEAHFEQCDRCRETVAFLRRLSSLPAGGDGPAGPACPSIAGLTPDALADHLSTCDRCLQAIAAVQDGERPVQNRRSVLYAPRLLPRRASSPWPALASLAAVAAICATLGWFLLKKMKPGEDPALPAPEQAARQAPPDPWPLTSGPSEKPARPKGAATGDERQRIEDEMRKAVERAREEFGRVEEKAPPPPPIPPTPPPPKALETVTVAATFEEVHRDVVLLAGGGRTSAKAGDSLFAGQGVETSGLKARATIAFGDGTKIEVGPDTVVRQLFDFDATRGKRIAVARGSIEARVTKQPDGRPLTIATPQGEARVLGTTLRLVVDGSTLLLVREGRVRLEREGKSVEVPAGHHATAAPGVELVSRPERRVWLNEFESSAGVMAGEIVVLKEQPRNVTAVASTPKASYADAKIGLSGGGKPLFTIPEAAEFRFRVKSEKAGQFEAQLIVDPAVEKQSFEKRERVHVGPEWREVHMRPADFFLWLDGSAMKPGIAVPTLNLYSFGAGRLYVDRIEVVSIQ